MAKSEHRDYQHRLVTIPNVLSLLRLLMIPLFVWLYIAKHDYPGTALVLLLSGLTDAADGFIARRFNMVSDLGKALDPVADKLTQIAMLVCLLTRFPLIWMPLIMLLIKEIADGVMGLVIIKRWGKVYSADWHGKVATFLLYAVMILHVLWFDIPPVLSAILLVLCTVVLAISFVLYVIKNTQLIRTGTLD